MIVRLGWRIIWWRLLMVILRSGMVRQGDFFVCIKPYGTDFFFFVVEKKKAILKAQTPTERLNLCSAFFAKQASISEVASKIAHAVDDSLSKQQKEFFLRQQLAAIQRELSSLQSSSGPGSGGVGGANNGNNKKGLDGSGGAGSRSELDDDEQAETDDLAELKAKIEAMAHGSEERKMGVREWRRLKRIPQGSVENGVIRSYVSCWLTLWISFSHDVTVLTPSVCLSFFISSSWNGSRPSRGPTPPRPWTRPYCTTARS
jgi:hypothetical protein